MSAVRRKRNHNQTTSKQFELLAQQIAKHPEVTRHTLGMAKVKTNTKWEEIAEKVNAIGPPYRSVTAWKKVWADLRSRTLKKMNLYPESENVTQNKFTPVLEMLSAEMHLRIPSPRPLSNSKRRSEETKSEDSDDVSVFICREGSKQSSQPVKEDPHLNETHVNYYLLQQIESQNSILENLSEILNSMNEGMERQIRATERQTLAIERHTLAMEKQAAILQSVLEDSHRTHRRSLKALSLKEEDLSV